MNMTEVVTAGAVPIGLPHEEASAQHLVAQMNLAHGAERFSCRTSEAAGGRIQELLVDGESVCLMAPVWGELGPGMTVVIALHFCRDETSEPAFFAGLDPESGFRVAGPSVFGLDQAEADRAAGYVVCSLVPSTH